MSYGGYQQHPPGYGAPPPGGYGYGGPAYAGFGKRLVAQIIDALFCGLGALPGYILIFVGIFGMAATSAGPRGQGEEVAVGMLGVSALGYLVVFIGSLAALLFNCHLLGRDGATLGKKAMKIKVLDTQGQTLGFGKAILREIVKGAVASVSCYILLLWPLWDKEKQGLQDKVFSTHVYDA